MKNTNLRLLKDNNLIVSINIIFDEDNIKISSEICIDVYSRFLLKNINIVDNIIDDFFALSHLKEWFEGSNLYKNFTKSNNKIDNEAKVNEAITNIVKGIAIKYGLKFEIKNI